MTKTGAKVVSARLENLLTELVCKLWSMLVDVKASWLIRLARLIASSACIECWLDMRECVVAWNKLFVICLSRTFWSVCIEQCARQA